MANDQEQAWYQSRTNVTALVLLASTMGATWGSKLAGLSAAQQDALVTVFMAAGVPAIIYFRSIARARIAKWRQK